MRNYSNYKFQIPLEDWREVIIELEVLPQWPVSLSNQSHIILRHSLDGLIMEYSRVDYIKAMENATKMIIQFYERFRPLLNNITVNSNLVRPVPTITMTAHPHLFPKRARFSS